MRQILIALASIVSLAAVVPATAQTGEASQAVPDGYVLEWSDEFEASSTGLPDASRWTYDTHANATGWYNKEAQYYAAPGRRGRTENARVENGNLIIEARREAIRAPDANGQQYTSARMLSREGWTYGLVEVRAKVACGRGTWPAIWMLPLRGGAWPLDGEIDIMEHVGHRPGIVHGTVHTGAYNHVAGTQAGADTPVPDACDAFHRYQTRWTPEAIVFMIDDREYYRFANDGAGDKKTWPFNRPFRLILNIAVGGDWGGAEGIDDAALPARMEVDYVRVYQPAR